MVIVNTDQADAWNGAEGADWVREARRFDRAIAPYHEHLLRAAAIESGDRVLDVGCGNGESTRAAARVATAGSALGVDLSSQMLQLASGTAVAEGVRNVTFEQADAQVHPFDAGASDAVISRFGVMFFSDPGAAFANIASALRPGGRLALVVWQDLGRNDWFRTLRAAFALGRDLPVPPPGAPGPGGLADPDRTRSILEGAGFDGVTIDGVDEPFWVGADIDDALAFAQGTGISRALLGDVSDADRTRAFDALRAALEEHDSPDGVTLGSAAWVVKATKS